MGLFQSTEGQNRTKDLTLPQERKNSFCLIAFEDGCRPLAAFELKHHLSLGVEPAGLTLRLWAISVT